MENTFGSVMANKSDQELLAVVQEKDRYEFEAYIAAIEELERRNLATPELLEQKKNAVSTFQAEQAQKNAKTGQSWSQTMGLFKISKEYFYTPILIYSNTLIWLVMVATGVNAFQPSVDSLIEWGGNLSGMTLNGEPWRLLTSTFLHGGLIHLLLNMYALIQVGGILETHFGKHRYAIVYLATGIFASIASAAFSENVVSVGASGAIFGLYGLLLSLLITKSLQMNAEERKALLSSTLFFVGYNVVYGFAKAGIDNAAHIGGLLSGAVIGFLYYPVIRKQVKASVVSVSLVLLVLIAVWAAPSVITNPYAQYSSVIETFSKNEENALWMYTDIPAAGSEEAATFKDRIKTEGIDLWNENIALLNSLENMPSALQERVDLLKKYCQLRVESCETLQLLLENETEDRINRFQQVNERIEEIINSLEALNK